MLFDKETRYWQEEYRKGNLDDVDMLGETRAILDGSAERMMLSGIITYLSVLPSIILMGFFGYSQKQYPEFYAEILIFLRDWVVPDFYPYDPTGFTAIAFVVISLCLRYTFFPRA